MTEDGERLLALTKARGAVEAERKCLRCGVHFLSTGFGERIWVLPDECEPVSARTVAVPPYTAQRPSHSAREMAWLTSNVSEDSEHSKHATPYSYG